MSDQIDPIMDEEQELLAQQRQLELKLSQIRESKRIKIQEENKRIAEEQRLKEQNKPIIITALEFNGAMVMIDSPYREDLIQILRNVPGRAYKGEARNMIPVGEWKSFVLAATALPNVSVIFGRGVKENMEWFLNSPPWLIEHGGNYIKATFGPRSYANIMYQVAGAELDNQSKKFWKIPLTEVISLYETLKDVEGVVWDEEVTKIAEEQLARKASLDKIALMDRGVKYLDFTMNGHPLRHFQEVGCEFIDAAGGNVLLGDEMGLGKSPQSIAYAVKNEFKTVWILCPASLKANWARQIKKFTNETPRVYSGAEPSQFDIVTVLTSPVKWNIINYDIIGRKVEHQKLTTDAEGFTHEENQTRFLWVELVNLSKPDLIITDEAHYYKNVESNRSQATRKLKAPRFLPLTGTPVLNRPGELWPMLTLIAPNQFPAYETFLKQYTYDGKSPKNVKELREILKSLMIRRLQKDVKADLPPVNRIEEWHELSEKAKKIYAKVEQGVYTTLAEFDAKGVGGVEKATTQILAQIQRLKMVCAIDKAEHTAALATELYDQTDESGYRKVLIFSQYKAVAYRIAQHLGGEALCFVHRGEKDFITANDARRDQLVQQFQNDPSIHYLVVTEKTAREGHDITAAGHVIFNDLFWTPANHSQAEGRAYARENDSHGISSYYHITDMAGDGIEEWIWELLAKKMKMINEVVEGMDAERDGSLVNELIQRMREAMWTRKR